MLSAVTSPRNITRSRRSPISRRLPRRCPPTARSPSPLATSAPSRLARCALSSHRPMMPPFADLTRCNTVLSHSTNTVQRTTQTLPRWRRVIAVCRTLDSTIARFRVEVFASLIRPIVVERVSTSSPVTSLSRRQLPFDNKCMTRAFLRSITLLSSSLPYRAPRSSVACASADACQSTRDSCPLRHACAFLSMSSGRQPPTRAPGDDRTNACCNTVFCTRLGIHEIHLCTSASNARRAAITVDICTKAKPRCCLRSPTAVFVGMRTQDSSPNALNSSTSSFFVACKNVSA